MKFIDDNTKKLYWWNRNYFFVTTVLIVVLNIILYGALGNNREIFANAEMGWLDSKAFNFDNLVLHFISSFLHVNWQHCLLNMLCFFIVGIYLERKKGTIPLLLLLFAITFFTSTAMAANGMMFAYGFSGVNYGLYAYVIVDYCFMFRRDKLTKFNIISGAVLLGLIYFAMCFSGGTTKFTFTWYPYDLATNIWHYSSFAAVIIFGLVIQVVKIIHEKQIEKESKES